MTLSEAQISILRQQGRVCEQQAGKESGSHTQGAHKRTGASAVRPKEHEEQVRLFAMAKQARAKYPELDLLNGSLNGVRLNIGQAKKAKAAGMKAGYPDLFLPVARGDYHGLFIELKVGRNTTTPEQKAWLQALQQQGYYCSVCHGAMEAWDEIVKYLEASRR